MTILNGLPNPPLKHLVIAALLSPYQITADGEAHTFFYLSPLSCASVHPRPNAEATYAGRRRPPHRRLAAGARVRPGSTGLELAQAASTPHGGRASSTRRHRRCRLLAASLECRPLIPVLRRWHSFPGAAATTTLHS
jgi:hypothetical protein